MTGHFDPETLADLMSGDIEAETLQSVVLPHLLTLCPVCREMEREIQEQLFELDHWDASMVVRESREAPALLERLMDIDEHAQRLILLHRDETLHTWGLAQLLLHRCREATFEDPNLAVELGELATALVDYLPATAYQEDWHADLRIRSWAYLGNAKRVLGEIKSAEVDLRRATLLLLEQGTGRPSVAAELHHLTASLRISQRRFSEALGLLDRAEETFEREGDLHQVGRCLVTRAKALTDSGRMEDARDLLRQVLDLLDPQRDPKLLLHAHQNLLCCLLYEDRFEEAQEALTEVRAVVDEHGSEMDRLRLRWVQARISGARGDHDDAEATLRSIQSRCLEMRLDTPAAIVSLDLAVLLLEQDRDAELRPLLTAILPLFESQKLHHETLATLRLFREAVHHESLNVELARQLLVELRQGCGAPA